MEAEVLRCKRTYTSCCGSYVSSLAFKDASRCLVFEYGVAWTSWTIFYNEPHQADTFWDHGLRAATWLVVVS